MTAYESIKKKLSVTGLYNINQNGLIDAEIKAYDAGLKNLYNGIDELLCECFIQTAEGWGLEQLEDMAKTYMSGDSLELRREKLMNRLNINSSSIGKDALEKQAASLGLSCTITENISESKLYLDILTEVADEKKDFLKEELMRFEPPHLIMYISFNGA